MNDASPPLSLTILPTSTSMLANLMLLSSLYTTSFSAPAGSGCAATDLSMVSDVSDDVSVLGVEGSDDTGEDTPSARPFFPAVSAGSGSAEAKMTGLVFSMFAGDNFWSFAVVGGGGAGLSFLPSIASDDDRSPGSLVKGS